MTTHSNIRCLRQRLAQGYLMTRQVSGNPEAVGKRCGSCRHFAEVFVPRCDHGDFVVTQSATCRLWSAARVASAR
jgi:hypothetical protein